MPATIRCLCSLCLEGSDGKGEWVAKRTAALHARDERLRRLQATRGGKVPSNSRSHARDLPGPARSSVRVSPAIDAAPVSVFSEPSSTAWNSASAHGAPSDSHQVNLSGSFALEYMDAEHRNAPSPTTPSLPGDSPDRNIPVAQRTSMALLVGASSSSSTGLEGPDFTSPEAPTLRALAVQPSSYRDDLGSAIPEVSALRRSTRARKVRVRREVAPLTEESNSRSLPPVLPSADAMSGVLPDQADGDDLSPTAVAPLDVLAAPDEPSERTPALELRYDDIRLPDPQPPATAVYGTAHPTALVRLALLTTLLMHVSYRLSFAACGILLSVYNFIFLAVGLIAAKSEMPTTLNTVLQHFQLGDRFGVYPVCSVCRTLFSSECAANSYCPDCENDLFYPASTSVFRTALRRAAPPPRPILSAPLRTLSSLLVDFLNEPGMEAACEEWKTRPSTLGKYSSVMDGAFWNELRGDDGLPFFDRNSSQDGELHLGVTFSLDWFGRKDSVYGPSHSSGAFAFAVANLPPELRARIKTLLLSGMTPGPKEPTAEQLQHYQKILVDDLLKLYTTGVRIPTPSCPEGRLIRVALLAIICDHPAMCKTCGTADHKHAHAPCHKCKVSQSELFSEASLANNFAPRTGAEHRQHCFAWCDLETAQERDAYFKVYGYRFSEFARLEYFDLVRCTIIDPMHNLLLGIVKNQWYSQWIKKKVLRADTKTRAREIGYIQDFLKTFEAPHWAGSLPVRVGEPAGGSLSADEYRLACVAALPLIIPSLWDAFEDENIKDYDTEQRRYQEEFSTYSKRLEEWQAREDASLLAAQEDEDAGILTRAANRVSKPLKKKKSNPKPEEPAEPRSRMQAAELQAFLHLATCLKILLARSIDANAIPEATRHLRKYLLHFRTLYGEDSMKPNHHWAVHIPDQIRDFGPVYEFWTFIGPPWVCHAG